ncbi:glycosyltransferase family 2 protein [Empedobacter falsenii]
MKNKSVTVVIASYKYGHLAAHCIESILSQSRIPDKILFVDDGVGDCFHLKDLYPQVEFTFRKKNLGIAINFDDMLKKVDTDYCMFLGADNWLKSNTIEEVMKFDEDIITYDIILTGELKSELNNKFPTEIKPFYGDYYWSRKNKHHGSMVYKTEKAKKFGYVKREGGKYSDEDWVLWDKMIADGASVAYINEAFLYYRRHKENYNNYSGIIQPENSLKKIIIYKLKKWLS